MTRKMRRLLASLILLVILVPIGYGLAFASAGSDEPASMGEVASQLVLSDGHAPTDSDAVVAPGDQVSLNSLGGTDEVAVSSEPGDMDSLGLPSDVTDEEGQPLGQQGKSDDDEIDLLALDKSEPSEPTTTGEPETLQTVPAKPVLPQGSATVDAKPQKAARGYVIDDTIDLSKPAGKTGAGFTISGAASNYNPASLNENPGSLGVLSFNASATSKVYRLIQSGVPNNPNSSKGQKYGTSMIGTINIQSGVDVTLIVSGIDMLGSVNGTAANLTLVLDGTNNIRTSIAVPDGAGLTVNSLNGNDTTDRLVVNPTTLNSTVTPIAARIGGNFGSSGGSITINSGNIDVTTPGGPMSTGAGIGGGGSMDGMNNGIGGSGGTITINGGVVKVTATSIGAGIGGGGASSAGGAGNGGAITINGGTVSVSQRGNGDANGTGRSGAGIGGGGACDDNGPGAKGAGAGNLRIVDGSVTVRQYTRAAGIGAGLFGEVGNITIDGGVIDAEVINTNNLNGSGEGAAIGGTSGTNTGSQGYITINGGQVRAVSKYTAIGLVHGITTIVINITGGDIYAQGGWGPGIGVWSACLPGDAISIVGGKIVAKSDSASGIGGGIASSGDMPFRLDAAAEVKAYAGGTIPAINVNDNTGDGYYVNASFNTAPSASATTPLRIFAAANNSHLKNLELPANFKHFAYSSDQDTARTDNVFADLGGAVRSVLRVADDSVQIYSVKTKGGYNAHGGNNQSLPVKLSNAALFTVTEKYVDINGAAIPAVADTAAYFMSGAAYSKVIPTIADHSVKGYKIGPNPPNGLGSFTLGTTASIPSVTGNTIVYFVYGLPNTSFSFYKVNQNNSPLEGVRFALYSCADDSHQHQWLADDSAPGCWGAPVYVTSAADGLVEFAGLESGHYMLVEVEALPGYQLPHGQWSVEISATMGIAVTAHGSDSVNLPPAFKSGNGSLSGCMLLPNYPQYNLPRAGGFGVLHLTILGCAMIGIALLFVVVPKLGRRIS
ncbi:MAG: prealbumin-like fold domain-containing protein [Actinomycetia bacterium]|nr:prealbumin-like fold domain-containing protein [Actinomycetes bacterium]